MIKLLLVSPDRDALSDLATAFLEHKDVAVEWAESGETGLDIASETAIDLAITDESLGDMSGFEFANRLLLVNPMINCASASSLSSEDFQEVSEGLGLMAQLPVQPGKEDAEALLQRLRYLKNLICGE